MRQQIFCYCEAAVAGCPAALAMPMCCRTHAAYCHPCYLMMWWLFGASTWMAALVLDMAVTVEVAGGAW